jgi:2-polyprenyl-3-methyl-5-hydroxy-6-metoxy-1,4-benzoquinol methylase
MGKLKIIIWQLRQFLKGIFVYPTKKLNPEVEPNYDSYWLERKGEAIFSLNAWQKARADMVISFIKNNKEIKLADVASGSGNILSYIKNKIDLKEAVAYDVSKYAVIEAKKHNLDAREFDISNMDEVVAIPQYDYFLLFEILEHLAHSELVLDQFYKKSTKGVFISVPNTGYISHRFRMLFGKFPMQWRQYPNEHLRFWTLKDMKWWLSALGYRNCIVRSYMGVPILKNILPNLFAAGIFVHIPKSDN